VLTKLAIALVLEVAAAPPEAAPSPREAELVEVPASPESGVDEPPEAPPAEDIAGPSEAKSEPESAAKSEAESAGSTGEDDGFDFDFDNLGSGFSDSATDLTPEPGEASATTAPGASEASDASPFDAENERENGHGNADENADESPKEKKERERAERRAKRSALLDSMLGGSLRLTGAYLHFDDEPLLFPEGDDALGVAVGRVTLDADAGEHFSFEFNGFVDLSRAPGAALGGAFASAGATDSVYRTRYLSTAFWDNGGVRGTIGVDRATTSVIAGPLKIDLGRMPINYSVTGAFAANDFYAPFSATSVNRLYKPGVDALRVSVAAGALASVDVVGVLGYDADGVPTWGRSSVLSRAGLVAGGFEWGVLGGKVAERWVVGGSAQGDAGPIGLRAEFHVGFPDADGDGRRGEDLPVYVRAAGGPNLAFTWHNASINVDYQFISDGAKGPSAYLGRATELYPDTVPFLARHYIAPAIGMDIVPILRTATYAIVNANDGSGLAGASLLYNVADESDFILGLFVPWGKGFQGFDPVTSVPSLGSEWGLTPLVLYLESRVFF